MVMGGAQIYRLLLDDCDKAYVTKVDASAEADRDVYKRQVERRTVNP